MIRMLSTGRPPGNNELEEKKKSGKDKENK